MPIWRRRARREAGSPRGPQTVRIVPGEHRERLEEINKFARETTYYYNKPVKADPEMEPEIPKGVDPLQVHIDEFADNPGLFATFMEQAIDSEERGGLVPYDFVDSFRRKLKNVGFHHSRHLREPCGRLVPHLTRLLEHPHPNVRLQAAGYLLAIAPVAERALPDVERKLKTETDPKVLKILNMAQAEITKHTDFSREKTKPPD